MNEQNFKSYLMWKVKWHLMVTERADPWDIRSAIGYPHLETDIEAIREWINDHYHEMNTNSLLEATQFCVKSLSKKLDAYYGHHDWFSPEEYER